MYGKNITNAHIDHFTKVILLLVHEAKNDHERKLIVNEFHFSIPVLVVIICLTSVVQ